jgi:hypothetical protein
MADIELGVAASTPTPAANKLLSQWHSLVLLWHLLRSKSRSHGKRRDEEKVFQPQSARPQMIPILLEEMLTGSSRGLPQGIPPIRSIDGRT